MPTAVATNALPLWEKVKVELKTVFPEEIFQLWFDQLVLVEESSDAIVLGAPNEMVEIWVSENYLDVLSQKFRQVAGRTIQIRVCKSEVAAAARRAADPRNGSNANSNGHGHSERTSPTLRRRPDPASPHACSLNPKNTFETFVVGPNNQLAHAAAVSVARAPAHAYNPLLIHGDTGLGKTHLMHAVGHFVLRTRPDAKVAYLSSEKFTNEYIHALQENTLTRFRQRYRNVDVMLVDDIQFLSGKERIQEEFFHTFNDLFESGKQIFLSSDRPVTEIEKLEKRLVTRFQWGMSADIISPDLETRIAILRHKAGHLNASIPDGIITFIAEHVASNIRQLEGALIKVASYANLTQKTLDKATAEMLLRDILIEEAQRQVTIEQIQKRVAEHMGLRPADMVSRRRPANIALPRQIAMYLSRELTRHSLQEIGEAFGGRDHGTVIHACKAVQNHMEQDSQFRSTVEFLRSQLT